MLSTGAWERVWYLPRYLTPQERRRSRTWRHLQFVKVKTLDFSNSWRDVICITKGWRKEEIFRKGEDTATAFSSIWAEKLSFPYVSPVGGSRYGKLVPTLSGCCSLHLLKGKARSKDVWVQHVYYLLSGNEQEIWSGIPPEHMQEDTNNYGYGKPDISLLNCCAFREDFPDLSSLK